MIQVATSAVRKDILSELILCPDKPPESDSLRTRRRNMLLTALSMEQMHPTSNWDWQMKQSWWHGRVCINSL